MIGPLALRPCALLRAWGFCHIWHFMRSPLRPLVRPCIFFASILMLSKSYLPRRCDWKGVVFYKSPYLCRGLDSFWFSLPSPFCIVTFYLAINLWGSSTNRPTKHHSTASTPMLEERQNRDLTEKPSTWFQSRSNLGFCFFGGTEAHFLPQIFHWL